MIEKIQGEKGFPVIRRDGRLLASRFDPWDEAENWLKRHITFTAEVKTIFVLGLASGYHVMALQRQTQADILVLEPDADLVGAVAEIHRFDPARVQVESAQDMKGLRASEMVREGLKNSFIVLAHPTSLIDASNFFADARKLLLGREWGALTWQWQIKGHNGLETAPRVDALGSPLTIYDLEQTELVQNSEEREKLLLKALRELVK